MRYSINISTVFLATFVFSCGAPSSDTQNNANTSTQNVATTTDQSEDPATSVSDEQTEAIPDESIQIIELPESHECSISTEVYEGNQHWFRGQNVLVAVTADESTFDEALGASHRLLVAYNTKDCSEIFKEILPVSVSADYPYYLTPIDSIKGELVGILGADRFFIFDAANNQLSKALNPKFRSNRQMEDAQSGAIIGMETWGRYVIGYVEDGGSFVYNLSLIHI